MYTEVTHEMMLDAMAELETIAAEMKRRSECEEFAIEVHEVLDWCHEVGIRTMTVSKACSLMIAGLPPAELRIRREAIDEITVEMGEDLLEAARFARELPCRVLGEEDAEKLTAMAAEVVFWTRQLRGQMDDLVEMAVM